MTNGGLGNTELVTATTSIVLALAWTWPSEVQAMGTGSPSWSGMVGSCLAIQAAILMTGSLLGLNQHLDPQGPPAKADSVGIPLETARLSTVIKATQNRSEPAPAEGARALSHR